MNEPLDTSPEAQAGRRAAMRVRLQEAGATRVSELSPLCGQPISYRGVAGTICYVSEGEQRFAADLIDGRRAWGNVADLTTVDGIATLPAEG